MSSSNCCFPTCIQISQEAGQVVWYSHLFQNFPQFIVIHIVKGFGIVNKAEIYVFLELSCFFDDPADVGNLISGSSAFSKPAWTSGSSRFTYCWSLAWRILSITLLACEISAIVRYFEHSLALPFFGIGWCKGREIDQLHVLGITKTNTERNELKIKSTREWDQKAIEGALLRKRHVTKSPENLYGLLLQGSLQHLRLTWILAYEERHCGEAWKHTMPYWGTWILCCKKWESVINLKVFVIVWLEWKWDVGRVTKTPQILVDW